MTKGVVPLSVIVVNYNGRLHLEQCLPAVFAQSLRASQVIVVDNGSGDDSVDYVRSCHPTVDVIEAGRNLGFSAGNSLGYKAATGEFVVLLNNDTLPERDWLEKLVDCALQLEAAGIIASHMIDWDGRLTDTAGDGCTVAGRGYKLGSGKPADSHPAAGYVFSACAGAVLYKRKMLDEVGFFETSFFMNAEDTDLAFRAQLAGWKVYFCADAIVRHRIGASQGRHSPEHVFYSTRNHLWLYVRCMPLALMFKHAPAFLLQSVLYLFFHARHGRLFAHLRGWMSGLAGVPRAFSQRAAIQRLRKVPLGEIEAQLTPLWAFLKEKQLQSRLRE